MLALRPYQRAALDGLYAYWQGGGGNGLVVLPTGAGKSLVIATLVRELLEHWPRLRITIVTHVRELVAQNMQEMLRCWPAAPVGIYSAGLGRRDARAKVLFASIQSVWNKTDLIGDIDVVIVDEAHLIARKSDTMYGRFLEALRGRVPDMRIVGLTATPYRLDSGRLDRGDDRMFDAVVAEANVSDLIADGFLSPLISKAMTATIDTSKVAVRGGEFQPAALEAAATASGLVSAAVDELTELGAARRAWIAFCTGVKHATDVRDELCRRGIPAEVVHGEMSAGDRDRAIAAFREGRLRCLTSVAVLTTGFNVPHVDLIALLRPTLSAGLYIQMVGRGFRTAPGKTNCLVLDFAGNVRRHGPVDAVKVREPGEGGGGEPPVKECPDCHSFVHAAIRACPDCGHLFPPPEAEKHTAKADGASAILSKGAPEWLPVDAVSYLRHEKPGKPPSVRAEYQCGMVVHREWICPEHPGFAGDKARQWWRQLGGPLPPPRTVDEALRRIDAGEINDVTGIRVRPSGQYHEVCGRSSAPRAEKLPAPACVHDDYDDDIPF